MTGVMAGAQFVGGCLALGLGLFLAAGAAREALRSRPQVVMGARTMAVMGGLLLLAGGIYAVRLSVPL